MIRSNFARFALLMLFALPTTVFSAAAQTPRAAPPNDNFANRIIVNPRALMNGSFTVASVQDATIQSGTLPAEPVPSCAGGAFSFFNSVWFELQAAYDVDLVIDTFESSLNSGATNDTVIAVYRSSSSTPTFGTLTEHYCSQNGSGAASLTWVPMQHGTIYLQVGTSTVLTSASSYKVEFGSRYELLANNHFGSDTANLNGWTVTGTGTTGDKAVCGVAIPRLVDNCVFRFRTSTVENSTLAQKLPGMTGLPHDTGPTIYSEFVLDVDYFTQRAQTNATAILIVKFSDGTKQKATRSLDAVGAIYVDPLTGTTPTTAIVRIKHTGKTGKPLFITSVKLYYAPGATGRREALLPVPAAP
jgi:hypothetical protein